MLDRLFELQATEAFARSGRLRLVDVRRDPSDLPRLTFRLDVLFDRGVPASTRRIEVVCPWTNESDLRPGDYDRAVLRDDHPTLWPYSSPRFELVVHASPADADEAARRMHERCARLAGGRSPLRLDLAERLRRGDRRLLGGAEWEVKACSETLAELEVPHHLMRRDADGVVRAFDAGADGLSATVRPGDHRILLLCRPDFESWIVAKEFVETRVG